MTTIELINLTLDEIRRSAQRISDVMTEQGMILKYDTPMSKKSEEVITEGFMRKYNALEYCRKSLRDVLEHIAEFQNGWGMTESVDAAIGKVAYDLIYERTTDEDYEPKRKED